MTPVVLSQHCTYKEAIYSPTAIKHGIDNTPDARQLENIKNLLIAVFEPLRIWANTALYVSSLFRSKDLNKRIGGANSSQHLCNNGAAMDIDAEVYGGITNNQLFFYIKDNLPFDQLILEDVNENGDGRWVHVSYNARRNRKDVLVMKRIKTNGKLKPTYFPYEQVTEVFAREAKENESGNSRNDS